MKLDTFLEKFDAFADWDVPQRRGDAENQTSPSGTAKGLGLQTTSPESAAGRCPSGLSRRGAETQRTKPCRLRASAPQREILPHEAGNLPKKFDPFADWDVPQKRGDAENQTFPSPRLSASAGDSP